jgi:hypothetical protein
MTRNQPTAWVRRSGTGLGVSKTLGSDFEDEDEDEDDYKGAALRPPEESLIPSLHSRLRGSVL